jgi:large subunit ribosomal protein L17
MRHRYNRLLELSTGVQKKDNVVRNLITSLLREKRVTTTPKRAKVLAYETEKLFAKLVKVYNRYENKEDSFREVKRILTASVFDEKLIPSIIEEKLLPYIEENRTSGFTRKYRVGIRKGDSVEKIMVELV